MGSTWHPVRVRARLRGDLGPAHVAPGDAGARDQPLRPVEGDGGRAGGGRDRPPRRAGRRRDPRRVPQVPRQHPAGRFGRRPDRRPVRVGVRPPPRRPAHRPGRRQPVPRPVRALSRPPPGSGRRPTRGQLRRPSAGDVQAMQVADIERWSLPNLLSYVDRSSMAFGVETRLPYLDPDVAALRSRCPPRSWHGTGGRSGRSARRWPTGTARCPPGAAASDGSAFRSGPGFAGRSRRTSTSGGVTRTDVGRVVDPAEMRRHADEWPGRGAAPRRTTGSSSSSRSTVLPEPGSPA